MNMDSQTRPGTPSISFDLLSLLYVSMLLISSCTGQLEDLHSGDPAKVEQFMSAPIVHDDQQFLILESIDSGLSSDMFGRMLRIKIENSKNYTASVEAYKSEILQVLTTEDKKELTSRDKADLLFITYWATDKLLLRYQNQPGISEDASFFLKTAMDHCHPVEWKRLASLLQMAEPALSTKEISNYRKAILKGAEDWASNNAYQITPNQYQRLVRSASYASDLLAN